MGKSKWSILGAWVVCYQQTYHFPFVLPNCVEFLFFIIPVVHMKFVLDIAAYTFLTFF